MGESAGSRFPCMDLVNIKWTSAGKPCSEDAIVLEVWSTGARLQTSNPIGSGSIVRITVKDHEFNAEVSMCQPDFEYGFIVDISVSAPDKWFPERYKPAWIVGKKSRKRKPSLTHHLPAITGKKMHRDK